MLQILKMTRVTSTFVDKEQISYQLKTVKQITDLVLVQLGLPLVKFCFGFNCGTEKSSSLSKPLNLALVALLEIFIEHNAPFQGCMLFP